RRRITARLKPDQQPAFVAGASSLTKSESKLSHSKMLLGGNRPKASFLTPNAARRKRPESKPSHPKMLLGGNGPKASFRTPNSARPKRQRKRAFALQILLGTNFRSDCFDLLRRFSRYRRYL